MVRKYRCFGDIGDLRELNSLSVLYLTNTDIYGDVGSLVKFEDLVWLELANTQVSGDISSLSTLKELKHSRQINLEGTNVSGTLTLEDGTIISYD